MLTITFLVAELWRGVWKARGGNLLRKSSFRTQEERDQLQKKYQQRQQEKLETNQNQQQQQQQQLPLLQQRLASPSSPRDDRKATGRIPIASKNIVPGVSPIQSQTIQPEISSNVQATPPTAPSPNQQQQPQQQQQEQSQTSQSHIPTPVQKSVKTLVLQPSTSGNKMSEEFVKKQIQSLDFSFDEADKDKSGCLSLQEIRNVLANSGFRGSDEDVKLIFGHMDKNQDQSISKAEFQEAMRRLPKISIKEFALRKIFVQLDKDGSGRLTKEEIMDATKDKDKHVLSAEKISDLLIYLSKEDDDGKIHYEQFLWAMKVEMTATVLYQIFNHIDKDGSGYLSRAEIMDAMSTENELKMTVQKSSDLLIYWCKDEDKKISYKEFIEVWLKEKEPKKN